LQRATEHSGVASLSDTPPEVARVQIEMLRRACPAQHFRLTRSLSRTSMWLARRALRRAMPAASEKEVLLAFIAHWYGQGLAEGVRRYLDRREEGCLTF